MRLADLDSDRIRRWAESHFFLLVYGLLMPLVVVFLAIWIDAPEYLRDNPEQFFSVSVGVLSALFATLTLGGILALSDEPEARSMEIEYLGSTLTMIGLGLLASTVFFVFGPSVTGPAFWFSASGIFDAIILVLAAAFRNMLDAGSGE